MSQRRRRSLGHGQPPEKHELQVHWISGDELLARLKTGEPLVVVDVRPAEEYQAAHVAGAVSIPLEELEQRLRELPREREVVAYCRGPYCAFAPEAVRTLRDHGYSARYLSDGLPEWADAGNGVESDGVRADHLTDNH